MYWASKLGVMAFARLLARELGVKHQSEIDSEGTAMTDDPGANPDHVTVVSCCPGFCRTDMSSYCYGEGQGEKSAEEGADTPVWLALMRGADARKSHGKFFTDRQVIRWE